MLDETTQIYKELVEIILGILLLINDKVDAVQIYKLIKPEYFFANQDRIIFECLFDKFNQKKGVTLPFLVEEVNSKIQNSNEEIDKTFLLHLLAKSSLSNNTETTCNEFVEISKKKILLDKINKIQRECLQNSMKSTDEIQSDLQKALESSFTIHNDFKPLAEAVMDSMQAKIGNLEKGDGIKTGFNEIDNVIGKMYNQSLVVIAARSSVGKTTLALDIIKNSRDLKQQGGNKRVAFFTLEMSESEIADKLASNVARIPFNLVKHYGADWVSEQIYTLGFTDKITNLYDEVKSDIYINDKSQTIDSLIISAKEINYQNKLDLIVIDYIGLIENNKFKERHESVGDISRRLKKLAKDLNCPILALCQINRLVSEFNKPELSNLRDSGSIEQDADVVISIHKDEHEPKNRKISILKNRSDGKLAEFTVKFNYDFQTYTS